MASISSFLQSCVTHQLGLSIPTGGHYPTHPSHMLCRCLSAGLPAPYPPPNPHAHSVATTHHHQFQSCQQGVSCTQVCCCLAGFPPSAVSHAACTLLPPHQLTHLPANFSATGVAPPLPRYTGLLTRLASLCVVCVRVFRAIRYRGRPICTTCPKLLRPLTSCLQDTQSAHGGAGKRGRACTVSEALLMHRCTAAALNMPVWLAGCLQCPQSQPCTQFFQVLHC